MSSGSDSVAAARELPWVDSARFFPIADNGVGDYWGFVLDHEVGSVREDPSYGDFLDFLAAVGLGHA